MTAKRKSGINSDFLRMLIILIVLFIVAGVTRGSAFMSVKNFQTMGKQLSEYGLLALGLSMAMITGGIDLSTVYIANLCGATSALVMQAFVSEANPDGSLTGILIGCAVGLLVGLVCGCLNGILVSVVKVPPMLATLGTYELFYGITIVLGKGKPINAVNNFKSFAKNDVLFDMVPRPFTH